MKLASSNVPQSFEDEKRLLFLKDLIAKQIKKLDPIHSFASTSGYHYPYAAAFFGINDGSEVDQLDFLAERQCFEKKFFDRVLLCPFCRNANINFHESCTSCKSFNLKHVQMIHHYRCAFVGPETEFEKGIDYVCPKCKKELKHIGVDYDRPGQSFICNDCQEMMPEAVLGGQCRQCRNSFTQENALRETIFSYLLTEAARDAVQAGRFNSDGKISEDIYQRFGVYEFTALKKRIAEEVERSRYFNRPFSLVIVNLQDLPLQNKKLGETEVQKKLKDLAIILKESIRPVDFPAFCPESAFIGLLPEVDHTNALKVTKVIQEKVESRGWGDRAAAVDVASYPDQSADPESLLIQLMKTHGLSVD